MEYSSIMTMMEIMETVNKTANIIIAGCTSSLEWSGLAVGNIALGGWSEVRDEISVLVCDGLMVEL